MPGIVLQLENQILRQAPALREHGPVGEHADGREVSLTKAARYAGHWGTLEEERPGLGAREGLSEEVVCSFQPSVTVLGTRDTVMNKIEGASTLRELSSCWGASGENNK